MWAFYYTRKVRTGKAEAQQAGRSKPISMLRLLY
jgi:hypothetical protein